MALGLGRSEWSEWSEWFDGLHSSKATMRLDVKTICEAGIRFIFRLFEKLPKEGGKNEGKKGRDRVGSYCSFEILILY